MQEHIEQARHNQNFHNCIEGNFEDNFFDWKITVLFYTAIHCLKALAAKKAIDIGETHVDIAKHIDPKSNTAKMRISANAYSEYKNLLQYSKTARYCGITDMETFQELKRIDHKHCMESLRKFKMYVAGKGVDIDK